MKKYYQLLLVVISVISIVSLVIYRNEYNRLRYVLEVLNFFGKPSDNEPLNCLDFNKTLINTNTFNIPGPAWQKIDESHYVYSSFWKYKSKSQGGSVSAVAIGLTKAVPAFMCQLWYIDQDSPVTGKFSYTKTSSDDAHTINAYTFYCHIQRNFGKPFSVVFYNNINNSPSTTTKVPVHHRNHAVDNNATLACVVPQLNNTKSSLIIEFLNFHNIIGVNEFIVYDDGHVPSSLVNPNLRFHITFLPWNFPFTQDSNFVRKIIEDDCLQRTSGRVESVFISSWNEFIVPKHHFSITNILRDFDLHKRTQKFQLSVLEFCIDYDENEASSKTQLIMHKLHYKISNINNVFNILRPGIEPSNTISTQIVDQNIAAVHKYIKCFDTVRKAHLQQSSTILRFNTDFITTVLYKLWITEKLF